MESKLKPRDKLTSHVTMASSGSETRLRKELVLKESKQYIILTQNVFRSFNGDLTNSQQMSANKFNLGGRRKSKLQLLSKSRSWKMENSSLDLKGDSHRRPVRVYVDDATKPTEQIKNTSTNRKRLGTSEQKSDRSMDSGDEGGDGPDDVIETVARVNTMHIDHAPVLPEIRAAPCPIHIKRQAKGSLESGPFSKDLRSPRRVPFQSMKNITLQQNNNNTNNPSQTNSAAKPHRVDISVRIPEQFPTRPPPLPKNMTSKDYVMTWLIHGSDPQGSNHFPEIVPANNNKTRTKHSPRKAHVSE